MNIYQRLNEVRKDIEYIKKDKRVEGYMAVTHDAVTAETRPHFIKHGIIIVPHETESKMIDTGMVSSKGTPSMRFEAKYSIDFVNIDEPNDKVTVDFTAHALDFGDKAPGKAHSYATKYAILKLLNIETGETDEGRDVVKPKKQESSKPVSQAVFDEMPKEEQDFLVQIADETRNVIENEGYLEAIAFIKSKGLDADERVALNSLFDSKERRAMKEAAAKNV